MAMVARSAVRRIVLALALLVAAIALFLGAWPIVSPETFLSTQHIEAVQQFFQTANASREEPALHASRAKIHTNNWAVLVCTSKFWFNYRVRFSC